ncbi:filamentous hemagglutinin N-terminal domain-containing protein [Pseudothauera nasutitermitis]|uniref:Filamentous hemagglutinin N-terminal domain-containing protein n=1 Tax=Pseudothauera nasutitermitis TaxID=2565930 RepID=A0A4S4B309_9RHOO|nr:hemagglutinin repeat-containing protein [Pseudothauera nasutitermitis]THF66565.1 filamentous hemagglutinin N-terminal domain-containing protein [Pseudothauera nasutitermitis]
MNANRFRVIYNRARAMKMVVGESARSCGRAVSDASSRGGAGKETTAVLRPLVFRMLMASGAVFWLTPLHAQIVADPSAAAAQRPTILETASGVPQINIRTPSTAGVSRNTYSQFDVDTRGAILNNSRGSVKTDLGGWVQGNPHLTAGTARVILNEVNSQHPSFLRGHVEVAGSSAQVVIANPAGIQCDGCGFINASRSTLTTGTPVMNGGNLLGYRVGGGSIRFTGEGMNDTATPFTEVIARAVEVNAGIWANALNVTTGLNQVDIDSTGAQTAVVPVEAGEDTAPKAAFAIDVAALGGMYAGKIHLVGTEAGVGVRNAGKLGAAAGEVVLSANGWLLNTGSIQAQGAVTVHAPDYIDNTGGLIRSADALTLTTGQLTNADTLGENQGIEARTLDLTAQNIDNRDGSLRAAGNLDLRSGGTLDNIGGLITAGQHLSIHDDADTKTLAITSAGGTLAAGGTLGIDAHRLTSGDLLATGNVSLLLSGDYTNTGWVQSNGALTLRNGGALTNQGSLLAGGTFLLKADGIDNTGGLIRSADTLTLTTGQLTNADTLGENQGIEARTLDLSAEGIDNRDGSLRAAGNLDLRSGGTLDNTGGLIAAGQHLSIHDDADTKMLAITSTGGTLAAGGTLGIDAHRLTSGDLLATGNVSLLLSGDYTNTGWVQSNGALTVRVGGALTNQATLLAGGTFLLKADGIDNTGGLIRSADTLTLTTGQLTNADTLGEGQGIEARALDLAARDIDNHDGALRTETTLDIASGGTLDNTGGLIAAGQDLSIHDDADTKTLAITSAGGTLAAGGALGIDAHRLTSGDLLATGNVSLLLSGDYTNTGWVQSNGTLTLRTGGALTNQATLLAGGAFQLDAAGIDNTGGLIRSAGTLTLTTGQLTNADTLGEGQGIEAHTLDIVAQDIDNRDGSLRAETALDLRSAGGTLDSTGGLVSAGHTLHIRDTNPGSAPGTGLRITGTDGTLAAGHALRIDAHELISGDLLSSGSLDIQLSGNYTNTGWVQSNGTLTLSTGGTLTNQATLLAGGTFQLDAADIDNTGGLIRSAGTLTLTTGQLTNADTLGEGQGIEAHTLDIVAQDIDNRSGALRTETTLDIASGGTLDNTGGLIAAGQDLSIHDDADTKMLAITSTGGTLAAGGTLGIDAHRLTSGDLLATGNVSLLLSGDYTNTGWVQSNGVLTLHATGALTNQATLLAGGAFQLNAADIDNTGGLIRSAGTLTLTTGQLTNADTLGEGQGIEAHTLDIVAQDIDNRSGALRTETTLDIASSGTLDNTGGLIAAGQHLSIHDDADTKTLAITSTGGTLAAGGTLGIDAHRLTSGDLLATGNVSLLLSGDYTNTGWVQSNGALTLRLGGALTNQATLLAGGAFQLDAAGIDNTGGLIRSAGMLTLTTGQLTNADTLGEGQGIEAHTLDIVAQDIDNHDGSLRAASNLDLRSGGTLDNAGGLISAGHTLHIRDTNPTSRLSVTNTGGTLAAGQALQLNAHELGGDGDLLSAGSLDIQLATDYTHTGWLQANGAVTLRTGGMLTNQATLLAGGAFQLAAADIDNTGGLIRSAGTLTLTTGQLTNADTLGEGQGIEARVLDLSAEGIDNHDGSLRAAGNLDLRSGGTLDNTGGLVSAGHTLHIRDTNPISRLGVTNTGGTLAAGQALQLNAHALGGDGDLLSAGSLDIQLATDYTHTGWLQANGAVTLRTGGMLTNQATLLAGGAFQLAAADIDNTGGLIRSAGTLTLTTGQLTNADTLGEGQGIEAHTLDIVAQDIDNHDGSLRAAGNLDLRSGGALDNAGGLVSAGHTLHIRGTAADTRLQISNTDGTLAAGQALQLNAHELGGDGDLLSAGSLDIQLATDYTHTGRLQATGDASLRTTGTLTNQADLLAGAALHLQAAALDNLADGSIVGGQTHLLIGGTLNNRGLIDGQNTLIETAALRNLGAGRIYGDHLAISAPVLDNLGEGGSAPVIAARERLDIGTQTLDNGEDALIFSIGDLSIGGALDADQHASGTAELLVNTGATIEALGHLDIAAQRIRNLNAGITTHQVVLGTTHYDQFRPGGTSVIFNTADYPGARIGDVHISYRNAGPYRFREYYRYQYSGTTSETQVLESRPGSLLSGGNLTLTGDLLNHDSRIIAGSLLDITGATLENLNSEGTRVTTYHSGTVTYYDYNGNWKCSTPTTGCYFTPVPRSYRPAATVETFALPIAEVAQYTHAAGSGATLPDTALPSQDLPDVSVDTTLPEQNLPGTAVDTTLPEQNLPGTAVDTTLPEQNLPGTAVDTALPEQNLPGTAVDTTLPEQNLPDAAVDTALRDHDLPTPTSAPDAVSAPSAPATGVATLPVEQLRIDLNALFQANPDPQAGHFIETDPRFANHGQWLSSAYMLDALGLDPAMTQKRLGDGFYEQRLVREQVAQLTGRRFLDGHADDEAQYQALMNAGVTVAGELQLVPGVALSAAQIAQLTSDIVWLVERSVTLPDGSTVQALVPQVYVQVRPDDLQPTTGLLAGNEVRIELTGDLTNSGTIAGRSVLAIDADNLRNLGGLLSAEAVRIDAVGDLTSLGGSIVAVDQLIARAGGDLTLESTTQSSAHTVGASSFSRTNLDRIAGLYVTGDNGLLVASAGQDLNLAGALVQNTGDQGQTLLSAGRDLTLSTVATAESNRSVRDARNFVADGSSLEVGTRIETIGDLTLIAGQDLSARAATVSSEAGALELSAGRDLTLEAGRETDEFESARRTKRSGTFSSTTKSVRFDFGSDTSVGSSLSGQSVAVSAGRDLSVIASTVVSDQGTVLSAGRDLSIVAGEDRSHQFQERKVKKSGLSGSGMSVSIGTQKLSQNTDTTSTYAAASTVGSVEGEVTLVAGRHYTQTGSDVLAPAGDIDIAAQTVLIDEARETGRSVTETKFKQSGLTLSLSSPVISAVQTAQQMSRAASNTDSSRMKALAAASTALSAKNAYDAVQAGQGTTIAGKDGQIATEFNDKGEAIAGRDASAAEKAGGINLSISLGSSKSSSRSEQTHDTAAGSTLAAGGDITITARGAGEDSDLTIQGSQVSAGGDVLLAADDAIELLAARNTAELRSKNKSSSASIGFSIGTGGLAITAAASQGKGKASGDDLAWTHTQVQAGDTVQLSSGGDTTLAGARVEGERVIAEVGGDLHVESLQDVSTYDSKQKNSGFSISIPITGGVPSLAGIGGNISAGKSKVESDYASVTERSGIEAGDGGFQVTVGGDTTLIGAAIASTDQAVEEGRNTFSTGGELVLVDLKNHAEYEAEAVSVNIGTGISTDGKLKPQGTSAGYGEDSGEAESVTTAGISGIAGDTSVRTGDAPTGIAPIFDADKVQKEIDAQVQITQRFGQLAPKAVGTYAANRENELRQQANQAEGAEKERLLKEADSWAEGGTARVALHALVGGLSGGMDGAVGAGSSAALTPVLAEHIIELDVPFELKMLLIQGMGTAIGGVTGGAEGAAAGLNETANNYVNMLQRAGQLASQAARFGIDKLSAAEAAALQSCANSPACRQLISSIVPAGVMGWLIAQNTPEPESPLVAQIPGYGEGYGPQPAEPLINVPDGYGPIGTPPLEDPEQLKAWLANALDGYPAEQAEQWARDLIHTLPAAAQLHYSDLILQAAQDAARLRNGHLAGSSHPVTGIPFDNRGYPDFSNVVVTEVKITQTGTRAGDNRAANIAAGLESTPVGYTWHHHQDGETMQLVPREVHAKTGHTGGFKTSDGE